MRQRLRGAGVEPPPVGKAASALGLHACKVGHGGGGMGCMEGSSPGRPTGGNGVIAAHGTAARAGCIEPRV